MRPIDYYEHEITPYTNDPFTSPKVLALMEMTKDISAVSFLDIGCNEGTVSTILRDIIGAKESIGVDISPVAVAEANQKGLDALVLSIDESNLPFKDSYFDFVGCLDVIEHVFDPDHLLDEIHRVLKPDGLAIFSTPNLASWHGRVSLLVGYQPAASSTSLKYHNAGKLFYSDPTGRGDHLRVLTLQAFQRLLRLHNFGDLTTKGCYGTDLPGSMPIPLRFLYMRVFMPILAK